MHKGFSVALLAAMACSDACGAQETPDHVSMFFLADSQIHNVYGTSLKQMFPAADWVSKVAIRPPEVNLLAPLTLRYALQAGMKHVTGPDPVAVVLGDGTNIGCSGEADLFDAEFARLGPNVVRLMAHGNHDTYMMGTVNSYGPAGDNAWTPGEMMKQELPVDEAWWTPTDAPELTGTSAWGRNWLDACYAPASTASGAGSTPMNKVRWLARYAASLEPHGLVQRVEKPVGDGAFEFSQSARAGTALARLNFRARGVWYRPKPGTGRRDEDYANAWNSFAVQAIDISPAHTLVLIDTSVRPVARGGWKFPFVNAGTKSRIGHEQLAVIEDMLSEIPADRSVVVAGHFPLKKLKWRERRRLIGLMRDRTSKWTYVSGHTHEHLNDKRYGEGVDWNIGSTTDWPIESHVLQFKSTTPEVVRIDEQLLSKDKDITPVAYSEDWNLAGRYSELCRHIGAARQLAEAQPSDYSRPWKSPTMLPEQCKAIQKDWAASANILSGYLQTISSRFDDEDDGYRKFVLGVAAGASHHESKQRILGVIP